MVDRKEGETTRETIGRTLFEWWHRTDATPEEHRPTWESCTEEIREFWQTGADRVAEAVGSPPVPSGYPPDDDPREPLDLLLSTLVNGGAGGGIHVGAEGSKLFAEHLSHLMASSEPTQEAEEPLRRWVSCEDCDGQGYNLRWRGSEGSREQVERKCEASGCEGGYVQIEEGDTRWEEGTPENPNQ